MNFLRISLHTRFALGLGAVLLPFLGAAAVGQGYLLPRLVDPIENILRELTEEMEPVTRLQTAMFQAAMPVNDYLVHGNPNERRQFAQLRQRVERAFREASLEHFSLTEERELIKTARMEWEQALPLGERLLMLPSPVGNAEAARDMERFDAHIDRAVSALDEAHDHFHRVLGENRAQAAAARDRALWVTLVAFVLACAASLFAGIALARSVTRPVNDLRQGAVLLAQGRLSHRVRVSRNDELGELAAAFNVMADRLEADQVALAELASRDGLTGLYNHRAFYTMLADEIERARRFTRQVSLLMLDVDHFKRINDTHGHLAGDAVLKALGELLRHELRNIDRICRYGGEELSIILPETDTETAAGVAERLRAIVEAQPFEISAGASLRMTVSIGIATWPLHADSAEALVATADAALYAAKRNGRNRTMVHDPALAGQPQDRG